MCTETVTDRIARLGITDIGEKRMESLAIAHPLVDDATFFRLGDARRVSRNQTIELPPSRYEHLSRGKGWARKGRGDSAVWGERGDKGYVVGPGHWVVGGDDGFKRKDQTPWEVEHVTVGDQIWTIAN